MASARAGPAQPNVYRGRWFLATALVKQTGRIELVTQHPMTRPRVAVVMMDIPDTYLTEDGTLKGSAYVDRAVDSQTYLYSVIAQAACENDPPFEEFSAAIRSLGECAKL